VATIIRSKNPGDTVTLRVDRGGEDLVIEATLQARSESGG
jgi:S1-C subfamily serine protease